MSDSKAVQTATACLAVAVPCLLAFNWPPSATFFNQAAACSGWGALLAWAMADRSLLLRSGRWNAGLKALLAALGVMALSAAAAPFWAGLPSAFSLSALGLIAAAMLAAMVGAVTVGQGARTDADPGDRDPLFGAFCKALLVAGVLSLGVALVQRFEPRWADGSWIAHAGVGRVGGNLRQPNHLSSLLLLAAVALLWWRESRLPRWMAQGGLKAWNALTVFVMVGLMLGVVLTVSRTGTLCVLLMAGWGVLDRRLSPFTRRLLWALPVIYVLCWWAMDSWAQAEAQSFAGGDQLHKSDLSSSRFGIWSNALTLIRLHPWFGVGWGEFNFAWSLTPFPGRPVAFFDHTHNLPLQLAVEMGIPLALLVMLLLGSAMWQAGRICRRAPEATRLTARCAFVMVCMMGLHSLLEYPLWYAYFLLPTAFAFGNCLGAATPPAKQEAAASAPPPPSSPALRGALLAGAVALFLGGGFAVSDYLRVVAIFAPTEDAQPLPERIAHGQGSWFFAHHADYAAATMAEHPSQEMAAFKRAPHYLLDTRLMLAWAQAHEEQGDIQKARYLAQRLREFHNPSSAAFFAVCELPRAANEPPPFQCLPPKREFRYEDFRLP